MTLKKKNFIFEDGLKNFECPFFFKFINIYFVDDKVTMSRLDYS